MIVFLSGIGPIGRLGPISARQSKIETQKSKILHSQRSATKGSTFVARRAGRKPANKATPSNTNPAVINDTGSVGERPNNKLEAKRVTTKTAGSPKATPTR